MRDVVLGDTVATEIVGRGDILRPAEHDGAAAPVPYDVEWRVMQPATLARLDRAFAAELAQWPEVVEAGGGGAPRGSPAPPPPPPLRPQRGGPTRPLGFLLAIAG